LLYIINRSGYDSVQPRLADPALYGRGFFCRSLFYQLILLERGHSPIKAPRKRCVLFNAAVHNKSKVAFRWPTVRKPYRKSCNC